MLVLLKIYSLSYDNYYLLYILDILYFLIFIILS